METSLTATVTVMSGATIRVPYAMTALRAKLGFCRTSRVTGRKWLLSTLFSLSSSSSYILLVAVLSATTGGRMLIHGSLIAEDDLQVKIAYSITQKTAICTDDGSLLVLSILLIFSPLHSLVVYYFHTLVVLYMDMVLCFSHAAVYIDHFVLGMTRN